MIARRAQAHTNALASRRADGPVKATPRALALIERLRAEHGSLVFVQSGGRCASSALICVPEGELPSAENDLRLGEIGGCSFFIDANQYERWGRPVFQIDVAPGVEEDRSLESLLGAHFVSRTE
ncbi:MAG TPA: DUF779 domain-containing protein [Solirubrobacteraceae bacterium]|nr:DUF779 domain-containing protein [Solirubrobacteraceae bacterium]